MEEKAPPLPGPLPRYTAEREPEASGLRKVSTEQLSVCATCEPQGQPGDNSVVVVIMMIAVMVFAAMVVMMIIMTPVVSAPAAERDNAPGGGQQRDGAN